MSFGFCGGGGCPCSLCCGCGGSVLGASFVYEGAHGVIKKFFGIPDLRQANPRKGRITLQKKLMRYKNGCFFFVEVCIMGCP